MSTDIEVTKEVFFKVIGPMDVMPKVDVSTFKSRHHLLNWEIQHVRQHIGRSISDSWGVEPTRFFLIPTYVPKP